ncbi:hypothetical protein LAZ67_10001274 [Cordylochernes scorpioides]|uniref:Integrase catalytic domain-containing protein n=1 Tax=Cordylochernes scorpioides TaxID=51811 RepID=A0ABY6KVS0_9ARAC|nr:hypothetical protein LAZ67_10001274 [Cordylochernes scorpioides]
MEVAPLPDMKSETVARTFYENWIVRFGAPHTVISDQGKQFTSQLLKYLTMLCGIKLRHSTANHPQCNGKIERLHRTIKTVIRAHNNIKWTDTLPTVILSLRAAIHKDNNHSFMVNDRVKKPLELTYEGPFPVLARTGKFFILKVKGRNVTISIDRLAYSDNLTSESPPAARPIVSEALPSTSSQQNPDPPDVEKYSAFQGTGSAPDLTRTRSGRIIKKPALIRSRPWSLEPDRRNQDKLFKMSLSLKSILARIRYQVKRLGRYLDSMDDAIQERDSSELAQLNENAQDEQEKLEQLFTELLSQDDFDEEKEINNCQDI